MKKISTMTQTIIQKNLYGKNNITITFSTNKHNIYCAYFSKFDNDPDDDSWMKDSKYRLYSLYKNRKENYCVWKRNNDVEDDEDEDIKDACYQLSVPTQNSKEVIQTFAAFIISKTKNLTWDKEFLTYYTCENPKGEKDKTISDFEVEQLDQLLIIQWE